MLSSTCQFREVPATDSRAAAKNISGNFLLVAEKEGPALRIKAHTWSVNPTTQ
jgi:hypothetical protein